MYKKTLLFFFTVFLIISAAAESELTLQTKNSEGQTVDTLFQVSNSSGIVAESENSLQTNLTTDNTYKVKQIIKNGETNVTLYDLNITQDLSPRIRYTNRTEKTPYLERPEKIYAFDGSDLDYSNAEIAYTRNNAPDNILNCQDYLFDTNSCSDWSINSSTDYSIDQQEGIFSYNVTGFSAYTAGDTAPRLNVTNIRVYNVTGLSSTDQKYEGAKIEEGLNKTFQTEQKDESASFRFTFSIENTGTEDWSLASADTLKHSGIDTGWTVDDIWYNIDQEYTGGSFSSGQVTWDTEQGLLANGSAMNASYVTDTSLQDTQTYNQNFKVQDSSTNAEDTDLHILEAIKYGRLSAEIVTPPNNTLLTQDKIFNMTANLTCSNGDCGDVESQPRYNTTDGQSVLPGSGGTPFALQESATSSCTLSSSEECTVEWRVNATGAMDTYHKLDANVYSLSYPEIPENSSERNKVEISIPIDFSLGWDTIDFGALNPGSENRSAEGNQNEEYNITVSEDSRPIDNLWVKGEDLTSTENTNYSIGISNVSYSLENDISTEESLNKTYQHVVSDLSPGDILTTFYWIDVPYGMTEGGYNGTITFKANVTE
ncbi:MAG: hypothetical protein ACI83Q_000575 [Colwellia polaris]|jgi:hypothetical protein